MATGAVLRGRHRTGLRGASRERDGSVLETSDAEEAAWHIRYLARAPAVAEDPSREARRTARRFLWNRVVDNLLSKVEFLAMRQGMTVTEPAATPHVRGPRGPCRRRRPRTAVRVGAN